MCLQKCLDKTDSVPFEQIKSVIESELGAPYTSVFSSIDPVPIASASVAQVRRARNIKHTHTHRAPACAQEREFVCLCVGVGVDVHRSTQQCSRAVISELCLRC